MDRHGDIGESDIGDLEMGEPDIGESDIGDLDIAEFDHIGRADTEALLGRLDQALPSPPPALLGLIALLAGAHLVVAAPWAVGADPFGLLSESSATHQGRDGAVGVVVAVAGLLTVWRPRWALPCFAFGSVALVGQLIAGIIDNSITQSGLAELIHATSAVLTTLIGLSAVRLAGLGPARRQRAKPTLRLVDSRDGTTSRSRSGRS